MQNKLQSLDHTSVSLRWWGIVCLLSCSGTRGSLPNKLCRKTLRLLGSLSRNTRTLTPSLRISTNRMAKESRISKRPQTMTLKLLSISWKRNLAAKIKSLTIWRNTCTFRVLLRTSTTWAMPWWCTIQWRMLCCQGSKVCSRGLKCSLNSMQTSPWCAALMVKVQHQALLEKSLPTSRTD